MRHDLHTPERILITGYGGFVAPHLAHACAERYPAAQLVGLVHEASLPQHPAAPSNGQVTGPVVTEMSGDITDGARLRHILQETRPSLIFHLAALSNVAESWQDPSEVLRINAGGFIRLVEAIRAEGQAPRLVVSGSGEQYGLIRPDENPVSEETLPRPANPYALSKVTQDLLAYQFHAAYGLDVVRARAFNHFGAGQSANFVIASFARQIALIEAGQAEPILMVGNLSPQRDFLAVSDVVAAYLALAEQGQAGEAYNVGSGVARSVESILGRLLALSRVKVDVRTDTTRFRPTDVPILSANTTKIQRDTDWRPLVTLDDGLRATLNYWRSTVLIGSTPQSSSK